MDRDDPQDLQRAAVPPARVGLPMIACGRSVKALHPDALTIFVGPASPKRRRRAKATSRARSTTC
ncbi:MAG: hypothetical protein ACLVL7_12085 [Anaerotruncus massiliensis (ex Togo et al. 2019)]